MRDTVVGRWGARLLSQPAGRVGVVGSLLMLASAGAVGLFVWTLWRDTLADSGTQAANLAAMTSAQMARAVQAVDLVLQDIRALEQELQGAPRGDVADVLSSETVRTRLGGVGSGLPLAKSFAVIDAKGEMVAYAGPALPHGATFADRDYFRHFATGGTGLYISAPVRSRVDASWTIFLARPLLDSQARFAGVVLAGLPLTYFDDLLQGLVLPEGSTFTLLRDDGVMLMRQPQAGVVAGQRVAAESPWFRAAAAGGGTFDGTGQRDGVRRIMAVQKVPGYPLMVNIGVSRFAALRSWRLHAAQILAGSALIMGLCAMLLLMLRRIVSRLENSRASLAFRHAEIARASERLRESQERLEAQSGILRTTLETMDQGLMMVDSEGRVAVCNHQAMQMLELPESLMLERPLLADVIAFQRGRGEFAAAEPAVRRLIGEVPPTERPTYERMRPNGTVIEIRSVALEGGGMVRTYTDITQRRLAEDRVRHNANHDALTQLSNRVRFSERLGHALREAEENHHSLAVLYLDLDHFKAVNDRMGHGVGDLLLVEVARRMRVSVRDTDTVARMGGDEFAIIQPNADRPDSTMVLARRLLEQVSAPYVIQGQEAVIGVSIGVAWYPEDGLDAEELLRHADAALYAAKRGGRNAVCCYSAAAC